MGCQARATGSPRATAQRIREGQIMPQEADRHRVQQLLTDGAQLIEVLPAPEYREEHLIGAINIPLKTLTRATTQQLDRTRPVIVYCWDYQ
jgi:rhodanese-related sulfurtransferase